MPLIQLTKITQPTNNSVKLFSWERFYIATWTLEWEKINFESSEKVTFENKPSRANQEVEVWDVIFAKMQNTKKTLLISETEKDFIYSSWFFVLRPWKDILSWYLKHFLNSTSFLEQKDKNCTGATQKALTLEWLQKIQIPLPPISNQKQIIQKLDTLTNLINLRKLSIEKTEKLTKSIFIEMFWDSMINEKGWEVKTIKDLVSKEKYSIKRWPFWWALKKEIFVNNWYLVYEQFHALNNDFSFARYFINEDKYQELKAFEVKTWDIIISCSWVYLWKLAIIPESYKKWIINQALLKITLDETIINKIFFIYVFRDENFKEKYLWNWIWSGIPNFPPMEEFKKFKFIFPPISLQNKFASIVEKNEENIRKQKESLKKLEELYSGIMQEIFRV